MLMMVIQGSLPVRARFCGLPVDLYMIKELKGTQSR